MITACFGVIAILFMAFTPAQAKFLSDEERVVALHRMKEDAHGDSGGRRGTRTIQLALDSYGIAKPEHMVLFSRVVLPAHSTLRRFFLGVLTAFRSFAIPTHNY